jgi:ribosomal protein L27
MSVSLYFSRSTIFCVFSAIPVCFSGAASAVPFEVLATSGQVVSGTTDSILNLEQPTINDNGDVIFKGTAGGPAILSVSGGTLSTIVESGDVAPGTGGATFSDFFNTHDLNNAGDVAFFGQFDGSGVTSSNREGVFKTSGGSLQLVAREGSAAPDTGGADFLQISPRLSFSDNGDTVFRAFLTGTGVLPGNDRAIFKEVNGALQVVAREGDSIPGTSSLKYGAIVDAAPSINSNGDTAFAFSLSGAGVFGGNDRALFRENNGVVEMVAREGDSVPGTSVLTLSSFSDTRMTDDGDLVFNGTVAGTGVTSSNNTALFTMQDGTLSMVARNGDPVPGIAGAFFNSAKFGASINSNGVLAFVAGLGGVPLDEDHGLFVFDPATGSLRLVLREGDLFELFPGDFRRIDLISMLQFALNDQNEVVMNLEFAEIDPFSPQGKNNLGEAIVKATVVSVPAALPLLLSVLVLFGGLVGMRRTTAVRKLVDG